MTDIWCLVFGFLVMVDAMKRPKIRHNIVYSGTRIICEAEFEKNKSKERQYHSDRYTCIFILFIILLLSVGKR